MMTAVTFGLWAYVESCRNDGRSRNWFMGFSQVFGPKRLHLQPVCGLRELFTESQFVRECASGYVGKLNTIIKGFLEFVSK